MKGKLNESCSSSYGRRHDEEVFGSTDALNALPRLRVATVATHRDAYFTSLLYSAKLTGCDLTVLGWGHKWTGFGMKHRLMYEFCSKCDPNDVVMFIDGFDCILLQPPDVVVRKFLEFGGRVVCTGEGTLHHPGPLRILFRSLHNMLFSPEDIWWPPVLPYGSQKLQLVHLNSGGYIGFARDLVRILGGIDDSVNDQGHLTKLYLENPHKCITIDFNCSIFHLYRTSRAVELLPKEDAKRRTRHERPCFDDVTFCSASSALASKSTSCAESEIEESGQVFPANSVCISSSPPSSSFIGKTALRCVVLDACTGEAPCVLHIHSRRPADWLMSKLGLPRSEGLYDIFSLPWYCFYSLYGCSKVRHRAGYFSAISLIVLIVISGLVLTLGGGAVLVTALFQRGTREEGLMASALNALSHLSFPELPLTRLFSVAAPAVSKVPFVSEDVPLAAQLFLRVAFLACVHFDTVCGAVLFPLLRLCIFLLPLALGVLAACVPSLWALALAYYDLPLSSPSLFFASGKKSSASESEAPQAGRKEETRGLPSERRAAKKGRNKSRGMAAEEPAKKAHRDGCPPEENYNRRPTSSRQEGEGIVCARNAGRQNSRR